MSLAFLKNRQPSPAQVKTDVREAVAVDAADDKRIESVAAGADTIVEVDDEHTGRISGDHKLSKLVDDDFPFDESQLAAVSGMINSDYAALTGAAGTGKTTTTKKLVDELLSTTQISRVDMRRYWSKDDDGKMQDSQYHGSDDEDDYELDESNPIIPSVVLCSYTGRATQMIKKNFPRDWHNNIMTIHRMLGFMPEYYEDWDPEWEDPATGEKGAMRNKLRFVPTYTADCKMPWDIIIIDEAGMLGVELWHMVWAAAKRGCRIYMIGDINQLPPVHGKSIFGFAMAKWPSFELTKVHRQQGVNNPIVDNAWRIIHGLMPQSEGAFQMIPLKGDAQMASRKVRAIVPRLKEMGVYEPIRDTIITPINGEEGSRGFALGQLPLNREFALMFNPSSENTRYIIDGGREKKMFAVGDKVMATRNDYEAGITNGMTGIIVDISDNGAYSGERERYGPVEQVNAWLAADSDVEDDSGMSLEDLEESFAAIDQGIKDKKEKRDRGPSSHIVTVRFGSDEHGFEIPFATLAEVGSLMTAYVATCHKMQGGESPTIIVICHDAHKQMLYREWLYTAVTRASQKCILLYSELALKVALNKQNIKGASLKEKVASFNAIVDSRGTLQMGVDIILPDCDNTALSILDREERKMNTPARLTTDAERKGGLASLIQRHKERDTVIRDVHIHIHTQEVVRETAQEQTIDGGVINAEAQATKESAPKQVERLDGDSGSADTGGGGLPFVRRLEAPKVNRVSTYGAVRMMFELSVATDNAQRLLPKPAESQPAKPKSGLAFLMAKKKESN